MPVSAREDLAANRKELVSKAPFGLHFFVELEGQLLKYYRIFDKLPSFFLLNFYPP